ncbi:hypothetical protein GCM10007382_05300 [Salinibacterium xinjiangense]|uniref:Uncharacterized protein, contains FMN-binding domain n=1 Tax=Salinibacterium xinjiangense TaxID=386302 RepID=A0A2C8ZK40_9MICO|nr:FMN-binding protein [Salinibacterium xinjiangense]GGK88382.1 hypothetical protein GCM10007382_05300 [Salinibacterium xinjiangense]SOE65161.1 Uncharacterized protein, contains FMN-binding domain [Salinibacterium xinjiangense]
MNTRSTLGSVFASVAVLIVGWQAGGVMLAPQPTTTTSPQTSTPKSVTSQPTGTTTQAAAPAPAVAAPAATSPADGTYTGASVSTRFGNVQVAVTLTGDRITDVTPLLLTNAGAHSVQISNRAAPIVHDEVIASQSAKVSNVGGATYTTHAYLASVQSALDQAGF